MVDDTKAGIKSTSLLFGNHVQSILAIFAGAFVLAMSYAGYLNHQGLPYYIVTIGGTSLHLAWQLITLKPHEPADCWKKFQVRRSVELVIFITLTCEIV
jgi:4-hydroxybenzoate polyprenyltransferase